MSVGTDLPCRGTVAKKEKASLPDFQTDEEGYPNGNQERVPEGLYERPRNRPGFRLTVPGPGKKGGIPRRNNEAAQGEEKGALPAWERRTERDKLLFNRAYCLRKKKNDIEKKFLAKKGKKADPAPHQYGHCKMNTPN